jgi:hypothetical protein
MELQIEETNDDVELIIIKIKRLLNSLVSSTKTLDEWDLEERSIHIRKLNRKKESAQRSIKQLEKKKIYVMEEINYLIGAYQALVKTEQIKPYDDVAVQKQYWNEKYLEEMNLRLLLNNRLDSEFVKHVLCLDDDAPVKQQMLTILQKVQKTMIEERDRQLGLQAQMESLKKKNN